MADHGREMPDGTTEKEDGEHFRHKLPEGSHQMRSTLFDFEELKRDPHFTVRRFKDSSYLGQTDL